MKEKLKPHRVVVTGDWQIPYHHEKAVEAFLTFLTYFQPHTLVLNGDIIDNYELSRFPKHPTLQKGMSFREEVEVARKILRRIRKILPNARIILPYGNHEMRFEKYIAANAEALAGVFSLSQALGLKELRIEEVAKDLNENWIDYRGLLIGHFSKYSKWSGYTAKNLMDELGRSFVQSHIHRNGMHVRTYLGRICYGIEVGCMADPHAVYAERTHWSHGFLVLYFWGNEFYPELIPVMDHGFVVNGKLYRF